MPVQNNLGRSALVPLTLEELAKQFTWVSGRGRLYPEKLPEVTVTSPRSKEINYTHLAQAGLNELVPVPLPELVVTENNNGNEEIRLRRRFNPNYKMSKGLKKVTIPRKHDLKTNTYITDTYYTEEEPMLIYEPIESNSSRRGMPIRRWGGKL